MNRPLCVFVSSLVLVFGLALACRAQEKNLLADPSFELTKSKDQFGFVFAKWGGWKYEGDCDFRVGDVAHSGQHSCLLFGGAAPKIRVSQGVDVQPGRYRVTAYLRGLDIGTGIWNATTELMFNDNYMQLKKNGTFGWTKVTYVADVPQAKKVAVSFGLMAPGYFWIDDAALVKVGKDVPLTAQPVLEREEAPIAPPGEIQAAGAVRCAECGYRNMPAWKKCFACGTPLEQKSQVAAGPDVKPIASFEGKSPFAGGTVVASPATGRKALRLEGYPSMGGPQDWRGYDFLKADLFNSAQDPAPFYVEIHDQGTRGYWDRVNYATVIPPGASTLIIPMKQLYTGEKSRPGRMLDFSAVTRLCMFLGEKPTATVLLESIRLERDDSLRKVAFDGLHAFSFGPSGGPLLEGFTRITPGTLYSKGRGYGLKNARVWRGATDVLQPEPLYENFMCIEAGGLAVDVPNGTYRVFVNIDNPCGFWGEYQVYTKRAILAQGKPAVSETMDFASFKQRYFHFWNLDDMPADNTFDKYDRVHFQPKTFDVDVTDGQLVLDFRGDDFACSVSAVVLFPLAKAAEGERFLKWTEGKRRFYFDNYFKRVLHRATGDALQPTAEDRRRGFVAFQRDVMQDVYYNDTPLAKEIGGPLHGGAFAGEYGPVTLGLVPLADLGRVTVSAGDLTGPGGTIPAAAIDVGYVSYRLSRVTMEGSVYTINPRLIMPYGSVDMPQGVTRQFWLTVKTPAAAKPGLYQGTVTVRPQQGGVASTIPLEFRVHAGTLDAMDIPVGPFSYTIPLPWAYPDAAADAFRDQLNTNSLRKMREYGFTSCSGFPTIRYEGFKNGRPLLDFQAADRQMQLAKDLGFLAVSTYGGGVQGFDAYHQDTAAMSAAGFKDYSEFIRAVYTEVQKHAGQNGWIPVYYNLGDEPMGDDLVRAAENAEAYRKAFPKGPPYFTACSSFTGSDSRDPHFRLAKALHAVAWGGHDEASVNLLHAAGCDWAYYNDWSRWTFGTYMYKAAKQFGMKYRLSWHWNACAGDPYYPLDCREDDYAWCTATPDAKLVPWIELERYREGLGDYRRLLTLERLAKQRAGTPAAQAARRLTDAHLAAFKLGQSNHAAVFPLGEFTEFRQELDAAIDALRAAE